jgi:hypothetical protein
VFPPNWMSTHSRAGALSWFQAKAIPGSDWASCDDGLLCLAPLRSDPDGWRLDGEAALVCTRPPGSELAATIVERPLYVFAELAPDEWSYVGNGHSLVVRSGAAPEIRLSFSPGLPMDVYRGLRAAPVRPRPSPEFLLGAGTDPEAALRELAAWALGQDLPSIGEDLLTWLHATGLLHGTSNPWVSLAELDQEGDRRVFYIENQGVCRWAYDASSPLALVSIAWDGPFEPESPSLAAFLVQALFLELLWGSDHTASTWTPEETGIALLDDLQEIPLPPWSWPSHPHRFHFAEDLLISSCPGEPGLHLQLGARSPRTLDALRDRYDLEWD